MKRHWMHKTIELKKAHIHVFCFLLFFCAFAHGEDSTTPPATPASAEKKRRLTNFEWDPMPGAKSYEIEIKPKKGDAKAFLFNVTTTAWNGELKPGKYTMRLRSKDHRGVPGEWSAAEEFGVKLQAITPLSPKENAEVKTDENSFTNVELKWEESTYAQSYEVTIKDESDKVISTAPVTGNKYELKLPVASKFTWTVIGFDEFHEKGQTGDGPSHFTLIGKQLSLPKIKELETPYVREINWEKSEFAEKYEITLKHKDNSTKKWSVVTKEEVTSPKLDFPASYKGGQYQLRVTALANLRQKSKSHQINFPVAFGDRSPAAELKALSRKSIDRIKGWYFMGSYLITQIQYTAINIDHGSGPSTSAFGGTGRLGLGWLDEEGPFGFLGIADLSGFIIDQKNYTYPSMEAHGIARYVAGDLGELRFSGGLYYKEIPEILANARTTEFSVEQLAATGIHTGGEYWYSMTSKLGLQLNGRVYYPLSGKTPTGEKIIPTMSYQFGFLGSYRLNDKATGLMGYAYRKDVINYKSNNTDIITNFTSNQTSIVGHYLNFFLEWNL
jgi:hypothetical protein